MTDKGEPWHTKEDSEFIFTFVSINLHIVFH